MAKRPKAPTKDDAEAICRARFTKALGREPSESELAEAVRLFRSGWQDGDKALASLPKRGKS